MIDHDPDCMHMEMEDEEGPYTLHVPPSVFDVIKVLVEEKTTKDGLGLVLDPWEDGAIPIHVERDDTITRYAFRMPLEIEDGQHR